jgi:hypothetical protein
VTAAVDWRLETRSRSTRPGRAQPASFPPPVRDQLGDQDQVVTTADQGGAASGLAKAAGAVEVGDHSQGNVAGRGSARVEPATQDCGLLEKGRLL